MDESPLTELQSDRLLLRAWQPSDLEPLAALNADPQVMRYFPATLSTEQSQAMLERLGEHHSRSGFTFWALERRDTAEMIGMTGIAVVNFPAPFTAATDPAVEIGWRLAHAAQGQGFATEAARAALAHALGSLELPEIVSFTTVDNLASQRVMQKIGMQRDPAEDFEHPSLPTGHPMRRHVLYRLSRAQYSQMNPTGERKP